MLCKLLSNEFSDSKRNAILEIVSGTLLEFSGWSLIPRILGIYSSDSLRAECVAILHRSGKLPTRALNSVETAMILNVFSSNSGRSTALRTMVKAASISRWSGADMYTVLSAFSSDGERTTAVATTLGYLPEASWSVSDVERALDAFSSSRERSAALATLLDARKLLPIRTKEEFDSLRSLASSEATRSKLLPLVDPDVLRSRRRRRRRRRKRKRRR